jgi:hypothetical protein
MFRPCHRAKLRIAVDGNTVTNAEVLVNRKSFPVLYAGRAPVIPGVGEDSIIDRHTNMKFIFVLFPST